MMAGKRAAFSSRDHSGGWLRNSADNNRRGGGEGGGGGEDAAVYHISRVLVIRIVTTPLIMSSATR